MKYYEKCRERNFRYLNRYLLYIFSIFSGFILVFNILFYSYIAHRAHKIRQLTWETGTVLPSSLQEDTLAEQEKDYFSKYNKNIASYNQEIGMDLSLDLEVKFYSIKVSLAYH